MVLKNNMRFLRLFFFPRPFIRDAPAFRLVAAESAIPFASVRSVRRDLVLRLKGIRSYLSGLRWLHSVAIVLESRFKNHSTPGGKSWRGSSVSVRGRPQIVLMSRSIALIQSAALFRVARGGEWPEIAV